MSPTNCSFYRGAKSPQWAKTFSLSRIHHHTQRRTPLGRTPLDGLSAPSQRPLPDNTQLSEQTDVHTPQRDSSPQFQKASGRRTTP
jgi:hypothetical protein